MPVIFILAVVIFAAIVAIAIGVALSSGKIALKKGGAPHIDGGSRGSDSSLNL